MLAGRFSCRAGQAPTRYDARVAQRDAQTPKIASLIRLTLATLVGVAGCADDVTDATLGDEVYDGCTNSTAREGFEVEASTLTAEALTALRDDTDLGWDELADQERCHATCAYAVEYPNLYPNGSGFELLEYDSCDLELEYDADTMTTIVGGTLSCAGDHVSEYPCLGRRPLDWVDETGASTRDALSTMALLEHVSITAFVELAAQLEELGAPAVLVERCLAAADDEREHVEHHVALGASVPAQHPDPASPGTSRLAIAMHNATEGCVAETWAALLAQVQAQHASEPATRRIFAQIAEDEARHAQLAWDLHTWLCAGLSTEEVERVEAARLEALSQLGRRARAEAMQMPASVRQTLGLPDPRMAQTLAERFGRALARAA